MQCTAVEEKKWGDAVEKKWGNLCGDSAVRHLMQCAVRQMQVAPSLSLPVQVCSRLPVLDGDEEADCASIGVSSRDDGGGGAAYSIVNAGDECIVLFGVLCLVKDTVSAV